MKRIFNNIARGAMVALAFLASVACQEKEEPVTISFEKANEVIDAENEATVKVVLSEAASENLAIPFTVSSTSEDSGVYTISSTSVNIKAGESEGSVVVKNNGTVAEQVSLTLRLGEVEGYKFGMNPQIVISLGAAEKIIWSFQKPKTRLVENSTTTVTVSISGEQTGDKIVTNREIVLPVSIAEGATAVEGEDFELSAKEIRIPAGERTASITVSSIKPVAEGSTLAFELSLKPESSVFVAGAVSKMAFSIVEGTFLDSVSGKWTFAKDLHVEDDDLDMIGMIEGELGTTIPFPVCKDSDSFEVAYDDEKECYVFTPSFAGDLSRYFRQCVISSPVVVTIQHPVSYVNYEVNEVDFSQVNFDFAKADSDLKAAKVYMSVKDNEAEVFLFCDDEDYYGYKKSFDVHADFGGELVSYGMKVKDFMGAIFSLHYKFVKAE